MNVPLLRVAVHSCHFSQVFKGESAFDSVLCRYNFLILSASVKSVQSLLLLHCCQCLMCCNHIIKLSFLFFWNDQNGFKCHTMSESHQRQLLLLAEDVDKYMDSFSRQVQQSVAQKMCPQLYICVKGHLCTMYHKLPLITPSPPPPPPPLVICPSIPVNKNYIRL